MRITGEPALVMQVKPFRETSALVQFFSRNNGRLATVSRGARRRRNPHPGLQPFNEVEICFSGRGGLQTLHSADLTKSHSLSGNYLAGGFYVFELLARLLREHDPHPRLFEVVCAIIDRMRDPEPLAPLLRVFEKRLLEDMGFGIDFSSDTSGEPIVGDGFYRLQDSERLERVGNGPGVLTGATLLAIAQDDYADLHTRAAAREMFRVALAPHLGSKPLASRALLKMR